ncbi:hypothetical protein QBC42DRAFT_303669 [Cladorrhinum samala]|uniref:Uncharacterized protein n=1 Tax=Cladorrhinum samala TaxID=585594 RepID=A0AAV9I035_9PEZI|nr:hypothetical protein QBC42DRAFT_303669 [Cladorrhinum samala]
MADTPVLHRCPVCFKTYKRREHLQRHKATHTSKRPHRCILCNASFQRTDVLKRHLQTCDGLSNPAAGRRRACDRCVRQKKACNSAQPCLNCEKRSVECVYSTAPAATPTAASPAPSTASSSCSVPPLASSSGLLLSDCPTPQVNPPSPSSSSQASSALVPAHTAAATLGGTPSSTSALDGAPYDDLNALIQQAISTYPVLDGSQQMGNGCWLDLNFAPQQQPQPLPQPPQQFPLASSDDYMSDTARSFQREGSASADSSSSEHRGCTLGFLYDFTSRTGLVSSFECATLAQRQQVVALFHNRYLEQHNAEFPGALAAGLGPAATAPPGLELSSWSLWLQSPIVLKLQQIVLLIKNVVMVKPNNSTVTLTWSPALEQQCLQFFTPSRVAKFIELYWSIWHPNVNFLHRPTFDPAKTKSILLAGMALIGACVSPDVVDNEDARIWFNCVEEMVFTDDDFCRDDIESEMPSQAQALANRRKLQALQAACVVCLYQNWEGTDASKRRIRRHRFSTVVSVARDLGIDTACHPDYTRQLKHEFDWMGYVMREELIRTFLWIFLIDTAFVIFNNLPYRVVIKELKMHMASPEVCFQAATAEQCIDEIHTWMPAGSPFCSLLLRDAIENLCIGIMPPGVQQRYSQLGPLNLFAMVSAIHYLIFQHQNFFGVEGQLIPINNALQNWINIWELCLETSVIGRWPHGLINDESLLPDTMWMRIGFIRYSAEYWLLGSLLTTRISSNTARPETQWFDQGTSASALSGPQSVDGKAKSVEPILDKYDQTSMRQVNDLIAGFQKFNVD